MPIFNTQLFIEGISIDLADNFDGSITYGIDDVKNVGSISSNFTKTITIPGSATNNKAFGMVYDIKSSNDNTTGSLANIGNNFDFKKKARCYILQDQQIIMQGYAKLISATTLKGLTSYDIQVSSDLTGLVTDLGAGRLEDLFDSGSSTPFDHQLTLGNITGSWMISSSDLADTAGRPYVYPLIDYGDYDTLQGSNFYSATLRPAMYAKKLFDLCLASASYTYSSSFLSSSYFQSMVIPYKDGQIAGNTNNIVFAEALNPATLDIAVTNTPSSNPAFIYNETDLPFYSGSRFTPQVASAYDFNINVNFNVRINSVNTGSDAVYQFFNNPILVYAYIPLFDSASNALVNSSNFLTFTLPARSFTFLKNLVVTDFPYTSETFAVSFNASVFIPAGQYAKIGISAGTPSTFWMGGDFFPSGFINYAASGSVNVNAVTLSNVAINLNSKLDGSNTIFSQFVPKDVKQIDYVQSVLGLFNLFPVIDKDQPRHFIIKTYDEFYQNSNPVIDWTNKIDTNSEIKITPIPQLTSKNLLFSYRPDQDYYNSRYSSIYGGGTYGQLRLDTGYEFNTDELDVLSSNIFSATPPVNYEQKFLPCETTGEILNSSRNTMSVSGYYSQISGSAITASIALSDNGFTKAREGGFISYWGKLYRISKVINSSQFEVRNIDGTPATLDRPNNIGDITYFAKNDTFSYLGESNKIFPAIYSSQDNNVTHAPVAVNPRILQYQGLRPCNQWRIQYTPQPSLNSLTASYFESNYIVSMSMYPVVSHLDDYTNPTRDLLFLEPNQVFFPAPGVYPTQSLFTQFWENTALSITDEDAKLLTAHLKLNSVDIANLDLSNRVNIDGTYFRVNTINNYNCDPSTCTEVEFVRLPFQIYQQQDTASLTPAFISASENSFASSSITNITVAGFAPSLVAGGGFPIGHGQGSYFSVPALGTQTMVVSLTSSIARDLLLINDGLTITTASINSGSSTVSISKNFMGGGNIFVTVSGSILPFATLAVAAAANASSSINGIRVSSDPVMLKTGLGFPVNHTRISSSFITYDVGDSQTIQIDFSGSAGNSIELTDTDGNLQEFQMTSSLTGTQTFFGNKIAGNGTLGVSLFGGVPPVPQNSFITASVNSNSSASIYDIKVNDIEVTYSSSQNYPIAHNQHGLFYDSSSFGLQNIKVYLTGSTGDIVSITDSTGSYSITLPSSSTSYLVQTTKDFRINGSINVLVSGSPTPILGSVIVNNGAAGATISNVNNITGFSLPGDLTNGQSVSGIHSAFSGSIGVTISTHPTSPTTLFLYDNGGLIQSQSVSSLFTGTKTFSPHTFSGTDNVTISLGIIF